MPEYITLKSDEYKYGNNFIEVARKKIEESEFISLSKGYYTRAGDKKYKNAIGFPDDKALKDFLLKNLQEI
jgi:hypothetical protein